MEDKCLTITYLTRASYASLNGSDKEADNISSIKKIRMNDGREYPYKSSQAIRRDIREQLAVMLYRYAQSRGDDVSIGADTNILSYNDAQEISEWAIPAMQWSCGAGIINGTSDTTLDPKGSATRAQVAAMLMRFCENIAE